MIVDNLGRPISWQTALEDFLRPYSYNSGAVETLEYKVRELTELLAVVLENLPEKIQEEVINSKLYGCNWVDK